MKNKIYILVVILCLFSWSCPKLQMAEIGISVTENPIIMVWDESVGLFLASPYITIAETAGVGVNFAYIQIGFFNTNGLETFYPESIEIPGGRVNAFDSITLKIDLNKPSVNAENVRISINFTDDNGNKFKDSIEVRIQSRM